MNTGFNIGNENLCAKGPHHRRKSYALRDLRPVAFPVAHSRSGRRGFLHPFFLSSSIEVAEARGEFKAVKKCRKSQSQQIDFTFRVMVS